MCFFLLEFRVIGRPCYDFFFVLVLSLYPRSLTSATAVRLTISWWKASSTVCDTASPSPRANRTAVYAVICTPKHTKTFQISSFKLFFRPEQSLMILPVLYSLALPSPPLWVVYQTRWQPALKWQKQKSKYVPDNTATTLSTHTHT